MASERGGSKGRSVAKGKNPEQVRYEAAKLDGLFPVLDGVAWMDAPSVNQISQFAGVDPRTAGKLLKNACQIKVLEKVGVGYVLLTSYPYEGTIDQKKDVIREALVKMPLLAGIRQFISLGEPLEVAIRKAATVQKIVPFSPGDYAPLIEWANSLGALKPGLIQEDLVDSAEAAKAHRHEQDKGSRIAFLSHSSADKPFIRQLATDLSAAGIGVWLDEQRIKVGESIPEKISQGLAESDFFLLAVSKSSVESEWVKKELNGALINEVQRRAVHVLPLKMDNSKMPSVISDKKYADFSQSYKVGLQQLIEAMKGEPSG